MDYYRCRLNCNIETRRKALLNYKLKIKAGKTGLDYLNEGIIRIHFNQ